MDHAEAPAVREPRVFGKLVRDDIPSIFERSGERAQVRKVSGDELLDSLKKKVVEEAIELSATRDTKDILEEAADVFEVLSAVATFLNHEASDIVYRADRYREERGGFERGVVLSSTYIPPRRT